MSISRHYYLRKAESRDPDFRMSDAYLDLAAQSNAHSAAADKVSKTPDDSSTSALSRGVLNWEGSNSQDNERG